jgi:hypothetical protein
MDSIDGVISGKPVSGVIAPQHFLYFLPLPHGQGWLRGMDKAFHEAILLFSLMGESMAAFGRCGQAPG